MRECVIILDFGGQYNQLIARKVRECGVYCEILSFSTPLERVMEKHPIGIIFTGGPNSVYEEKSPKVDAKIFELGVPVLGICYGCQLIAHTLGGKVVPASNDFAREYGKTPTTFDTSCSLFKGLNSQAISWMSHGDYMEKVPEGFAVTAKSEHCPNVAISDEKRKIYGVQFHPEVNHTEGGFEMIKNFVLNICGAKGDWSMDDFRKTAVESLRKQIGGGRVLLALSGGVDSSVLCALLGEAIGKQLTCVFVDHGLMRKNEGDEIEQIFSKWDVNFVRINAKDRFLSKLKGVTDPQQKRKIIGAEFGYVFVEVANEFSITKNDFFAQGTIYPDLIESGHGDADVIKYHHNTVLPKEVIDRFKCVIEPLRLLFKDEIRSLGFKLGLPKTLVMRQPFPGPGLGIRIIGEVTEEKVKILQEADYIFREEVAKAGEDGNLAQYFAVLTDTRSVGVMGDGRTYDRMVAIRAVNTTDFMTANWARIPYDLLDKVSNRIINEVKGINRIVYDITSKPPATVEWE